MLNRGIGSFPPSVFDRLTINKNKNIHIIHIGMFNGFFSTGITFDTIYNATYTEGGNPYSRKKFSLGDTYLGEYLGPNGPSEDGEPSRYVEKELVFLVPSSFINEKYVGEKRYIIKKAPNESNKLIVHYITIGGYSTKSSDPVPDLFTEHTENTGGGKKRSRKTKRKINKKRKSKKRR